jgi:hypothetical protein
LEISGNWEYFIIFIYFYWVKLGFPLREMKISQFFCRISPAQFGRLQRFSQQNLCFYNQIM